MDLTPELMRLLMRLRVIASGGVADINDIYALKPHVADGIAGVITGRAIYDGRLDLAEALKVASS